MVRYDTLVLLSGLLAYVVSIFASTALVFLFFRLNSRLLPLSNGRITDSLTPDPSIGALARVIALGSATLCEAILLRHGVYVVMTLIRDFLANYGNHLLSGQFPFLQFLKLLAISALLMAILSAVAVMSIWIAGAFFDWMTPGMKELEEIAKGNIPVAVFFAFVLFAVTAILNQGIEELSRALVPYSISGSEPMQ